ncbi:MAG: hypothetical protein QXV16_02240 [Candidatus Anstonellales archaeon]
MLVQKQASLTETKLRIDEGVLETKTTRRNFLKALVTGMIGTSLSSCVIFNNPTEGRFVYDIINPFGIVLVRANNRTLAEVYPFPGGVGVTLTNYGLTERELARRYVLNYLINYSEKVNSSAILFDIRNEMLYAPIFKIDPNRGFQFKLRVDMNNRSYVNYSENQVFLPRAENVYEFAWNYNLISDKEIEQFRQKNPKKTLYLIDSKTLETSINKYIELFKAPTDGLASRNYLLDKYPRLLSHLKSKREFSTSFPSESVLIVR